MCKLRFILLVVVSISIFLERAESADEERRKIRHGDRLWHRKTIPYIIHQHVPNETVIRAMIKRFNTFSCLQWIPKKDYHIQYVSFDPAATCSSLVGRNQDGNHQSIFLGPDCSREPIILHEMFHVAGFYHELRRFDRDKHVVVNWENILPGFEQYFKKLAPEDTPLASLPYDTTSVMHYGTDAYSKNPTTHNKPTVLSVKHADVPLPSIGRVSSLDVLKLNRLYQCQDVHKGWSSWSEYTKCDTMCKRTRYRFCWSQSGDDECLQQNHSKDDDSRVQYEISQCSQIQCSIDGDWSYWNTWSRCNVFCGNGVQTRQRTCDNPAPRGKLGQHCAGKSFQEKICKVGSCTKGRYDCEFDNDGLCGWEVNSSWKVASSPFSRIGPGSDVSFSIGNYLLLASDKQKHSNGGDISTTNIPTESNGTKKCFTFYLQQTGSAILKVIGTNTYGSQKQHVIASSDENLKVEWEQIKISLIDTDFKKITIQGYFTEWKQRQFIAIDDVFFTDENCTDRSFINTDEHKGIM